MNAATTDKAWNLIAAELRSAVGRELFDVWISPLRLEAISDSRVTVSAPPATCAWVADRFGAVVERSVRRALGTDTEVVIIPASSQPTGNGTAGTADAGHKAGRPMPSRRPSPKLTFEQFVIGPENRFAHGAALSVAENPGVTYNPLFLCGPPGVGKTHLLNAIATYAAAHGGGRILLTNAEDFGSSFVEALRTRRMDEFKAHHRQVDMILVDDVQFLMDKARTEEEFFHTFNSLSEGGSQIVLACDRAPAQLEGIADRLRDRLGSGLVAPIGRPDISTRRAALHKRVRLDGLVIDDDAVLDVLAAREESGNIRALEAALIRAVAFSSLSGKALTPEIAAGVIQELDGRSSKATAPSRASTIEEIAELVSEATGVGREELTGSGRGAGVAWARQVAMHLCRVHTRSSTAAIGSWFGGRTHGAVIHACRRVEQQTAANPEADRQVRMLSVTLAGSANNLPGDRRC